MREVLCLCTQAENVEIRIYEKDKADAYPLTRQRLGAKREQGEESEEARQARELLEGQDSLVKLRIARTSGTTDLELNPNEAESIAGTLLRMIGE